MKVKAGNEVIQAVISIDPGGELDEAMLPAGTRLVLKAENPFELPKDHSKRRMIEEEGKVLFIAEHDGYCIPMCSGKGKWDSGVYVPSEDFHVIQFDEGEFFADDTVKYKSAYGEMTEAEFLREHLKKLNLRQGQPGPYVEATREWFEEQQFGQVRKPRDEGQLIQKLTTMEPSEIRAYFTEEEIEKHKLERATKDRLIVAFLSEGKAL